MRISRSFSDNAFSLPDDIAITDGHKQSANRQPQDPLNQVITIALCTRTRHPGGRLTTCAARATGCGCSAPTTTTTAQLLRLLPSTSPRRLSSRKQNSLQLWLRSDAGSRVPSFPIPRMRRAITRSPVLRTNPPSLCSARRKLQLWNMSSSSCSAQLCVFFSHKL